MESGTREALRSACTAEVSLLATEQEQRRVRLVPRLLVSLVVGLLILAVSAYLAFQDYCDSAIRTPQRTALEDIAEVGEAIEEYRQEKHVLPKALRDLPKETHCVDETGAPVDRWGRPLHYWTDGTDYRVTIYGYDGKPGGVGLDYDLSTDDIEEERDSKVTGQWRRLPLETSPTFKQFATDRGRIYSLDGYLHGSGLPMLLTSIVTGVVAFILAFLCIGGTLPTGRSLRSRVVTLIVTVAAALFTGMLIAQLHVPSGH